ncbi:DNA alkylation repair protein [Paenibacillus sediminis]|uniref:3-methyladenine DNA glycosylase AlkD n=1 Tax=Paenibacillus sediminis TaxID=664909 RepID=A0ABS4H040_9BACL|nr:DNA alkylation repair protein [Paenibacillus sediminis]MBP1935861.1 3-methyladenine DNA glycosylase AlkD [Paenibacillus sediminis]
MTQFYVDELTKLLSAHAHQENAKSMKAYMKNHFEFLGIRKPDLNAITKQFIKEHGIPTDLEQLLHVVTKLWELPEREYQYVALELLGKKKKQLTKENITFLERLVISKSWWDTVDFIAPHIIGHLFSKYPEMIPSYTDKWIQSNNMWLQRSAILFQLKYKSKTDTEVLYRVIEACADSSQFFIRKAIGWALREYSKTDPTAVVNFVQTHQLSSLSEREALKVLYREGKL